MRSRGKTFDRKLLLKLHSWNITFEKHGMQQIQNDYHKYTVKCYSDKNELQYDAIKEKNKKFK